MAPKKYDMQQYPHLGLYCPAKENHQERRERLLAALSDDSIFLHCSEHDWIRIEFYLFGKKINLRGVTAIASQVRARDARDGRIIFDLKPIPIHARGKFQIKRRKWRQGMAGPLDSPPGPEDKKI